MHNLKSKAICGHKTIRRLRSVRPNLAVPSPAIIYTMQLDKRFERPTVCPFFSLVRPCVHLKTILTSSVGLVTGKEEVAVGFAAVVDLAGLEEEDRAHGGDAILLESRSFSRNLTLPHQRGTESMK